jgi:hypothetical protein
MPGDKVPLLLRAPPLAAPVVVVAPELIPGSLTLAPPTPLDVELDDDPGLPEEFAVPKAFVPGEVGSFAELPAPLGSFPELFMPRCSPVRWERH